MNASVDNSTILYALGTVLGVFAIFYFGQEILLSLSPTVKSVILFVSFAFFLMAGLIVQKDVFTTVLTVLSGGAYLIFLGYMVFRFSPSTNEVFLLLAFSSALFVGLGYAIREKAVTVTRKQGRIILAGCAAVVLVLIAFDATGPKATVDMAIQDQVDVSSAAAEDVVLGTVRFENPFVFSRFADVPQFHVCLYAPAQDERLTTIAEVGDMRGGDILLGGVETREAAITARFRAVPADNHDRGLTAEDYRELGTLPVEQADECIQTKGTVETAKIVVAGDSH